MAERFVKIVIENMVIKNKFIHFFACPFTGLGLHAGFRGNVWLKNRIHIFEQFVLPSLLLNQTNTDFILWVAWRPEEKSNPLVMAFQEKLNGIRDLRFIFTFGGCFFWDDKYSDEVAAKRLMHSLEISLPELKEIVGDNEYVLLTLQPSDDLYLCDTASRLITTFTELLEKDPDTKKAVGYKKGYIINYATKEIAEYNTDEWKTDNQSTYHTNTTPPFFTILFSKDEFLDPEKHYDHIGPYKSHEYIIDYLDYTELEGRGFVVGCHGENISTTFNHRYKGRILSPDERDKILLLTGTIAAEPLKIKPSARLQIRKVVNVIPLRGILKNLYYKLPGKLRII
ncbi:MAG: hypothetical protein A2W47_07130 [Gammaproteobacteria bacterium RIFCSPHIGHO2_12_38_15]|nr:MAG: hypothetical protein A2W47_07130 [Gammaproteobacteria bacterium RIFCSPHIGHO2_12_38_15]